MTDIPKFHQFMRPLLEVLQEHGEHPQPGRGLRPEPLLHRQDGRASPAAQRREATELTQRHCKRERSP